MKKIIIYIILAHITFNFVSGQSRKNKTNPHPKLAFITVYSDDNFKDGKDSLELTYRDNEWGNIYIIPEKTIKAKIGAKIPIKFGDNDSFSYATLVTSAGKAIFISALIEPGDNLKIHIKKQDIEFSGTGSGKFKLKKEIEERLALWMKKQKNIKYFKAGKDNIISEKLKEYKPRISHFSYELIKTDYIFDANFDNMYVDSASFILFAKDHHGIPQKILSKSTGYLESIDKAIAKQKLNPQAEVSYIKNNFSGSLRDRLLTVYLINRSIKSSDDVSLLTSAINTIQTQYCIQLLEKFKDNSSPGSRAYEFVLKDTSGNIVKQSDFRGKVVLIDFFFTGCGWCEKLNTKMNAVNELYKNDVNISFVSISIDKDEKKWKESVRSMKYSQKGSIALYTNGEGSNSEVIKHYNIKGYPRTILIDKEGKIVSANPPEPHDEKGKKELISLLNSVL